MRRVRLTFHEGQVTTYDCPGSIDEMLNDLAVRTGYDLRPCLSRNPEVVEDVPVAEVAAPTEGDPVTAPSEEPEIPEAPAAEIPGTEPEAPTQEVAP